MQQSMGLYAHRVQYDDSEYQYAYYWHKLTHQQESCSTRTATSATTSRRSFGSTRTV